MRNIRLVSKNKVVQDEIGNMCEIYAWENVGDIERTVAKFARACGYILKKGITQFRICTQNGSTAICRDILNLYKTYYPNIKVNTAVKKYNPSSIEGYVILFNINEDVVFYDKEMMPIILSYNFNDMAQIKNDFSGIDLMD